MWVFWRKGYANTSIEDLVGATGVNRYGLYGEFESKRGLFLAALDHYQQVVTWSAFSAVERPGASLAQIRAFFRMLIDASCSEMGRAGCLMVNSAAEVAPYDRRAANKVERFRNRLQLGFRTALSNAKSGGELSAGFDVDAGSDFLVGVMHGMSVLARSNASRAMMANVVETSLAGLR